MRKKVGKELIVLSLILITIGLQRGLTGGFIDSLNSISWSFYLGLLLMVLGILLMETKKTLDVIIIPTAGNKKVDEIRTKKAFEYGGTNTRYMIIGEIGETSLKESQRNYIYNYLRKAGVKPEKMLIGGGRNSQENLKSSLQKLKRLEKLENIESIGIASYPSHLDRFEGYFNKLKKRGKINQKIKLERIPTEESAEEKTYGALAKIKEKYHLGWLNRIVGPVIKKTIEALYRK